MNRSVVHIIIYLLALLATVDSFASRGFRPPLASLDNTQFLWPAKARTPSGVNESKSNIQTPEVDFSLSSPASNFNAAGNYLVLSPIPLIIRSDAGESSIPDVSVNLEGGSQNSSFSGAGSNDGDPHTPDVSVNLENGSENSSFSGAGSNDGDPQTPDVSFHFGASPVAVSPTGARSPSNESETETPDVSFHLEDSPVAVSPTGARSPSPDVPNISVNLEDGSHNSSFGGARSNDGDLQTPDVSFHFGASPVAVSPTGARSNVSKVSGVSLDSNYGMSDYYQYDFDTWGEAVIDATNAEQKSSAMEVINVAEAAYISNVKTQPIKPADAYYLDSGFEASSVSNVETEVMLPVYAADLSRAAALVPSNISDSVAPVAIVSAKTASMALTLSDAPVTSVPAESVSTVVREKMASVYDLNLAATVSAGAGRNAVSSINTQLVASVPVVGLSLSGLPGGADINAVSKVETEVVPSVTADLSHAAIVLGEVSDSVAHVMTAPAPSASMALTLSDASGASIPADSVSSVATEKMAPAYISNLKPAQVGQGEAFAFVSNAEQKKMEAVYVSDLTIHLDQGINLPKSVPNLTTLSAKPATVNASIKHLSSGESVVKSVNSVETATAKSVALDITPSGVAAAISPADSVSSVHTGQIVSVYASNLAPTISAGFEINPVSSINTQPVASVPAVGLSLSGLPGGTDINAVSKVETEVVPSVHAADLSPAAIVPATILGAVSNVVTAPAPSASMDDLTLSGVAPASVPISEVSSVATGQIASVYASNLASTVSAGFEINAVPNVETVPMSSVYATDLVHVPIDESSILISQTSNGYIVHDNLPGVSSPTDQNNPPANTKKPYTSVSHFVLHDYLNIVSNSLMLRLDNFARPIIGVAAGDETTIEKGLWAKIFGGAAKQKAKGDDLGFKNYQRGFLIGGDAELKEDVFIAGIAYSNSHSETKFKDISNANDRQKTNLHIAALYSQYNLSPQIVIDTHLKYGRALIKTERSFNNQLSQGNTTGDIYRAHITTAYKKFYKNGLSFVPKLGLTYDNFRIRGFKETGNGLNLNILGTNGYKLAANIGLGVKKLVRVKSFDVIPGIHFNIDRTLSMNNAAAIITTIEDSPRVLSTKVAPQSKTTYIVGTSVNLSKTEAVEFSVGYDYSFRPGFYNHSGFGSVSIKF